MSYILQRNQSKAAYSHHALYSLFRKELIFALLLLATAVPAVQGQTYYVFYNENVGYIYDNGTDIPSVTSDLSTAIIWQASAAFGNTGINIRSYIRSDKYLRGGNNGTALSLGNTQSYWRLRNNVLNYNNNNSNTVKYTTQLVTGSNDGNRFTPKVVTIGTTYAATVPAVYHGTITGSNYLAGSGNSESFTLAAIYTESYNVNVTPFTFDGSIQFRDTAAATAPTPTSVNLNDGWTVTWSLSDDTYATISSSGVLTTKATLPTTSAITTVQVHATKGGNTIDASMTVSIWSSVEAMYTVTIDDREDHNWTYYQATGPDGQYPPELRSPNPRNVKITYRGGSVANASAVAVSPEEPQNTFVYYKTIERLAWGNSTGRWLEGEYAYQVIPNPFSKRPRTTTPAPANRTSGYFGFGGWKIISGGEYIAGHNNNDVLGLEEIINFTGLDAGYTPNCTSAEVVFEATWTAAYVVESITTTGLSGSSYETNFIVVRNNNSNNVQDLGTPATVSSRYPDGTASGYDPTILNFRTSNVAVKLEYIKIGDGTTPVHPTTPTTTSSTGVGSGTFQATSGYLIVGRGCSGTVNYFRGGGNGGKQIRIESGKYQYMYPMSDGSADNGNYCRLVLGCDYDRAASDGIDGNGAGDNTKLRVVNYCSLDGSGSSAGNNANELMDITVKSGYYGFSANRSLYTGALCSDGYGLGIGGNTDNFGTETYTTKGPDNTDVNYQFGGNNTGNNYAWRKIMSFYVGPTRSAGKGGVNRMLVEGGEFGSINGGGTRPGADNTGTDPIIGFYFRMKGGWVKGAVYGTASISDSRGSRSLVFTGGEVNGWVAGGCNGTDFSAGNGINNGTCYIYAGGRTEFRSHDGEGTYNNAYGLVFNVPGGQIFGAGRGLAGTGNQVRYCGSTTTAYVVVADEAEVEQNVYGGGYNGVSQASHVYVTGGTVGGKVFGGTARAISTDGTWRCRTTDIRMYGGTVLGGVYGSHDETGNQYSNVEVQILGGTVGAENQKLADNTRNHDLGNVFGCGFGVGTSVDGDVMVIIGDSINSTTHTDQPTIWGNVFGGGHEANYTVGNHIFKVLGYNGTVKESIFGGGKGVLNQEKGKITGNTNVWFKGFIHVINNVYGGGLAGVVTGNTNVKLSD